MSDSDKPEDTKKLKRTQADREKEQAEEGEEVEEETTEEGAEEDGPQFVDLDGNEEMGYLVEDEEAAADAVAADGEGGDDAEEKEEEEGDDDEAMDGQEVPDMGEEEPVVEITEMAIAKFDEHTDSVLCVDVSHDGKYAVSGGCDEVGYLWSIPDAKLVCKLAAKNGAGHTDSVSVARFSSDDKLVATGGLDGCVCIWTVPQGRLVKKLEGPDADIQWLNWHPRGPVVVAGSVDSTVWLWNARSGDCLSVLSAHTEDVTCGMIIRGGTRLLTGSNDATVKLWDPKDAAPLYTVPTKEPVLCLAASQKEPIAVAGLADNTAYIFNVETGKIITRLLGHEDVVESVGFVSMFVPSSLSSSFLIMLCCSHVIVVCYLQWRH